MDGEKEPRGLNSNFAGRLSSTEAVLWRLHSHTLPLPPPLSLSPPRPPTDIIKGSKKDFLRAREKLRQLPRRDALISLASS